MQKEQVIEYYYVNCSISATHINNSGSVGVVTAEGPITKEAYGISLSIHRKENICLNEPQFNFPSFTPSYAVTKKGPRVEIFFVNKITDIKITTLTNFNATHPAGSDISEYFKVFSNKSFSSIESFVDEFQKGYGESPLDFNCNLLLVNPPDNSGIFQFKIEAILDDGTFLETTTTAINLE